jgi:hypothetical protein
MRCLACGAEMNLVKVTRDDTMMVPGYEDQTLECSGCHQVEQRRIFRSESVAPSAEPAPTEPPSIEPPSSEPPSSEPPSSEALSTESPPTEAAPLQPSTSEPLSVDTAPPMSILPDGADEPDEGEEMLRRAIAMVRAPTRGSQPVKGLTEPRTPAALAGSMRSQKSIGRVVQIRHDPSYDAAYAAKDTRSGLVVLRHQDSSRLREMCDRLGWQVVEDGTTGTQE